MLQHPVGHWRSRARAGHVVQAFAVSTSSPAGFVEVAGSGRPTQVHCSVAKAGILSLTSCAASELGRYGVRVNAIGPGARTRMSGRSMPELVDAPGVPPSWTGSSRRTSRPSWHGWRRSAAGS